MQIAAARKIKWLKTTGIPKQTKKQEDPSSDYGEAVWQLEEIGNFSIDYWVDLSVLSGPLYQRSERIDRYEC